MKARRLLLAVSGLVVWSSGLITLYAAHSLGCEAGIHRQSFMGVNLLTWLLAVLLLAHLVALGFLQWHALRLRRRYREAGGSGAFLASLTVVVTAVSLLAMLVVGLPILLIPPCT